jgi:hypothetical protein
MVFACFCLAHLDRFFLLRLKSRGCLSPLKTAISSAAMPTHAEVIAQNPLEAPADFRTNAAGLSNLSIGCQYQW